MDYEILRHFKYLKDTILSYYPEIKVYFEKKQNEYYFIINNKRVFDNEDFKELLMKLYVEYIWKNNLNILFTYNEERSGKLLISSISLFVSKSLNFGTSARLENKYDIVFKSVKPIHTENNSTKELYKAIATDNSIDYKGNKSFEYGNLPLAA